MIIIILLLFCVLGVFIWWVRRIKRNRHKRYIAHSNENITDPHYVNFGDLYRLFDNSTSTAVRKRLQDERNTYIPSSAQEDTSYTPYFTPSTDTYLSSDSSSSNYGSSDFGGGDFGGGGSDGSW